MYRRFVSVEFHRHDQGRVCGKILDIVENNPDPCDHPE